MIEPKPSNITAKDWTQTPPAVRNFILQNLARLEQHHNSKLTSPPLNLPAPAEVQFVNPSPKGGRILVVDDIEMNRDMLSRRLIRQGHRVELATTGWEALEMLRRDAFDLVLLDIMMPEINGYEVLERIKTDSALAHIPVIMITAVDEIESVIRCIELGAEDHLPKPFNPTLLKARVEASLEKKWLRDQQEAYLWQLNLENKRKSDELEQARKIQLSMLPDAPPAVAYLDIAALQKTASEVGGDYYDFFPKANRQLRLAIGDATGHGVASGLMVSMTKASLLGATERDLSTLLHKINHTLTRVDLGPHLNMALLLLELTPQPDNQVLVQAIGGGMPPIYILRHTGKIEELIISGLPLGVIEEAIYRPIEFSLGPGEALLLASDGLPERFNAAREFLGFDRLAAALERINAGPAPAANILNQVVAVSDAWAQSYPLHDDMTLVVVRVK